MPRRVRAPSSRYSDAIVASPVNSRSSRFQSQSQSNFQRSVSSTGGLKRGRERPSSEEDENGEDEDKDENANDDNDDNDEDNDDNNNNNDDDEETCVPLRGATSVRISRRSASTKPPRSQSRSSKSVVAALPQRGEGASALLSNREAKSSIKSSSSSRTNKRGSGNDSRVQNQRSSSRTSARQRYHVSGSDSGEDEPAPDTILAGSAATAAKEEEAPERHSKRTTKVIVDSDREEEEEPAEEALLLQQQFDRTVNNSEFMEQRGPQKVSIAVKKQLVALLQRALDADEEQGIFALPVDEEYAPGYSMFITHPMDLSTIKDRLERRLYCSLAEMESDLHCMFSNCLFYNDVDSFVAAEAKKQRSLVLEESEQADTTEYL